MFDEIFPLIAQADKTPLDTGGFFIYRAPGNAKCLLGDLRLGGGISKNAQDGLWIRAKRREGFAALPHEGWDWALN